MKHIVSFSGGKDSLATLIWVKNNISSFEVVFCDTGWENPITYDHIKDVEKHFGLDIIRLKSKYTFETLAIKKKRVPSARARFCTEHLKIRPFIDYVLGLNDDVVIYQGIRAEESNARRKMKKSDEYFAQYENKKGLYRSKDVLEYIDIYTVDVRRPVFNLTSNQVFEIIETEGIKANPLYYLGFSRVGCFPCIMARHSEIRQIIKKFPQTLDRIKKLESKLGRSFFSPGYIPLRVCNNKIYPTADEVVRYINNPDQLEIFPAPSCESIYNICE